MPDQSSETADLFATVEEIRKKRYSYLDPELVNEILEVQRKFTEDRAEGRKRTEQIINRWAAQQAPKGEG
ncbi:hypothetical protein [Streptomyces sp. NPDC002851]